MITATIDHTTSIAIASAAACPVAEIDRQIHRAFAEIDAAYTRRAAEPGIFDPSFIIDKAETRILGLRVSTTWAAASSKRGLLVQLAELDAAVDAVMSTSGPSPTSRRRSSSPTSASRRRRLFCRRCASASDAGATPRRCSGR